MSKPTSDKTTYLMTRVLYNPHLWVVTVIMVLLVIVHYHEAFKNIWLLDRIGSIFGFGLIRHTLERVLFLIPVLYGTAVLGIGAGVSLLVLATAAMLPRVFLLSTALREALFETSAVILTGILIILLFHASIKSKQRLNELETTQNRLNSHIKRLSMLHIISSIINQSLDLNRVVDNALDKVRQVMDSQASWLYLWYETENNLRLSACCGLPQTTKVQTLKLGEGPEGKAAQQLKPLIIGNFPGDPLYSPGLLSQEGIRSLIIVPLMSKGKILGTLGVGSNSENRYPSDEVDLLTAIGDQFSMAIENARLYEKAYSTAEALRISERNYRDIFENASDAIWVHDLDGKILAANDALGRLTGYGADALIGANVSVIFPDYNMTKADKDAHDSVLKGKPALPYEQKLVSKDGSDIFLQIGTSLISRGGASWAFQHIARDITEEKRNQDNLRLYVQKVSQAQEGERKRIARELHDETAQALVVISRHLEDLASGNSRLSINSVREEVKKVLEGVRHFSQELRPSILDDLGLLPAIKWLASDLTKNYGIDVETEVTGKQCQLPPETELMLFRIAQEALTNIRRHSKASKARIGVEFSEHSIRIKIQDNGKGFEIPTRVGDLARIGKLGLAGMQERAQLLGGKVTIDSEPGKGTILTVEVPL